MVNQNSQKRMKFRLFGIKKKTECLQKSEENKYDAIELNVNTIRFSFLCFFYFFFVCCFIFKKGIVMNYMNHTYVCVRNLRLRTCTTVFSSRFVNTTAFRRAGASVILTYYAKQAARWLNGKE
uniref:Uncharacterized protein n=1 Tax=Lotharella globosa TaxID=91324 RepID=A0A7S3YUV3_9EUKA